MWSLYGLKQPPRVWFEKFSTVIQEFDMTRNEADYFVFCWHSAPNMCICLVVYIDDIVIATNDKNGIGWLSSDLALLFHNESMS